MQDERLLDFTSLADIRGIDVEIVGKDYIPIHKSNYNLLAGNGGTGKSMIALKMLCHFLVEYPDQRALGIFSEDTKREILSRLADITATMSITVDEVVKRTFFKTLDNDDGVVFTGKQGRMIVDNTEYLQKFKKNLILHDVGFVVLDPLERFHSGLSENDESDMKHLVTNIFQRIAVETSSAILVLHHTSKGDTAGFRGSGVIANKGRIAYNIRKNKVYDKELGVDKVREGWEKSVVLSTIKDNHYIARHCSIIQYFDGKLDLPVRDEPSIAYQDKYGRATGAPKYDMPVIEEPKFDNNPTLTMSFKVAEHDSQATAGFIREKVAFEDVIDKITGINKHYSATEWEDGYRHGDRYIGNEDFIVFDFDEGTSIPDAKERFKKYNALIITTKSHGKKGDSDRFRVIVPLKKPFDIDKQMVQKTKQEIYKSFKSDVNVANLASKFRGSPDDAEFYYTNGSTDFDWTSFYRVAKIEEDRKRYENEAKRLSGADFSSLGYDEKIKALQTRFINLYSGGNRNSAVADVLMFGKSLNIDASSLQTVVDGLVSSSGDPLGDREMSQLFKYHLRDVA